ncbi:SusC/RagA family TonB-linked outer membrane protein [Yeosuana aromativorans]|uniref:SusC/RagA family TonB-linked outer membrane protein n=1 Tax=Yeosuana aromativorans TaxID=288019 RepID=A0A8J3FFB8_9FLAO|nr:TonB-dependent receptor [Yeosuana aromativorans]GGK12269.1 SusC/RagA family TonB-linked outer membrane protein [Yeosuana aromativorans]
MRTFIFLCCTVVFALTPKSALSQNSKIKILEDKTLTVDEVFDLIMDQTDYTFFYEEGIFDGLPKVQLKKGTIGANELLRRSLSSGDFEFSVTENNAVLIKEKTKGKTPLKPQEYIIQGLVTDDAGQPLPGANIIEKGTNNGTQTDFDGKFNLVIKGKAPTLVISYLGYKTKEVALQGETQITVVLKEDAASLDEVVVVGYGTQKKVTLTGAVSDIKTDEIQESQTANLANNLTGRIPGLIINSRGGEPGSDEITTLIRGIATTGNNTPLYVIDGIPNRGSFERLNPNDIESISVLKDASAAIYGAQAANGVILITTKRGKEGKTQFTYNQSYSLAQPTRRPFLMNARQYLTWIDEINVRNGRPMEFQDVIRQYRDGSIDSSQWADTDWWDVVTSKWTPQLQHALSIRGGNEKTQFYLSGQFLNQDAIYTGDAYGYKQYNMRSNIDTRLAKNLKLGFDLSGRFGNNHRPTLDTDGLIRQIFVQAPYEFPYFENGLLAKTSSGNPISLVNGDSGNKNTKTKKFDSKFSLHWDLPFITKGLYAKGYAAIDYYTTTRKDLSKPFDQYQYDETTRTYVNLKYQTGNISLFQQFSEELNKTFHFELGYDQKFGKHNISSFIAYEQYQQKGEYIFASRQNLISEDIPYLFSGSDENKENGGKGFQTARQNYFGRLNYGYDDKYLADITMRYDGSANFPKGKRFGFFPAVTLGWRISKEHFFKSDLINELKIRGSWGLLGNDRVDNFQYLQIYNIGNSYIFGENPNRVNGLTPGTTPNPNITWETSEKINLGLDFSLKRGLLDGSIDAFYEKRSDILAPRNASVPVYSGLTLPDENIGRVSNQGVDAQVLHRNNIKEFKYSIGGQFTYAKSKIIFIDEPPNVPEWQRRTGKPVDFILLYQADGIYQNQDEIDNSVHFPDAQPGDVRIVDKNNDGVLNEQDQIILQNSPTPKIVYGCTMGLEWKDFSLNILFQGQAQAQTIYRPFDINQQSEFYEKRWRSALRTPNAEYPAAFDTASSSFREVSTIWIKDNSFLRLKNVELSYSFNKRLLDQLGLDSLRFFVSGHNLLIIYDKVKINDPESSSSTGWFYPQQRLLSTGLSLTF